MSELNEILSALGPEPERGVARRDVFKEVDADGSGEIGFDEFCTCMQKAKEGGATAPKRCGGDGGDLGVENETSAKQTYPSYHTISSTKQWHIASQHMHESLLHKVSRL